MSAITKSEALVQDLHKALLDKTDDVDQLYSDVKYHVRGTDKMTDDMRARELGQRLATSNTKMHASEIEKAASSILHSVYHYSNKNY